MADPMLIAKHATTECHLLPGLANRHGLITGATGTGKTVTLQTLAENFSRIGVPVFMAAWSSSNGTGHPPVYIDDVEIKALSAPTQFRILTIARTGAGIELTWEGATSTKYKVLRSTNVTDPASFVDISGDLTKPSFTDTTAPAASAFYRVQALP